MVTNCGPGASPPAGPPLLAAPSKRPRHDGWTERRRQRFLEVLAATANVTLACAATGKSKCGAYALRRRDEDFAEAWDEAIAMAVADLLPVAVDRALHGTEREVRRANGEVEIVRQPSDRLLMFLLSRRDPLSHTRSKALGKLDMTHEREICARIEANVTAIEIELGLR